MTSNLNIMKYVILCLLTICLVSVSLIAGCVNQNINQEIPPVLEKPAAVEAPAVNEAPAEVPTAAPVETPVTQPTTTPTSTPKVTEVKEEVVKSVPVTPEQFVVNVDLTEKKVMKPADFEIKKGTKVRWTNKDEKFNHNLMVYHAEVKVKLPSDVLAQSGNIKPGESWEYVFKSSGDYIVKDVFSGTMRNEITAEATQALISEMAENGNIVGTFHVE